MYVRNYLDWMITTRKYVASYHKEVAIANTIQCNLVYVIHNLSNNLMGLPAIVTLNILTQVNAVHRVDNLTATKLFHG